MALLTQTVLDNLSSESFLDEFSSRENEYIVLAHNLALKALSTLNVFKLLFLASSEEDFAEKCLLRPVSAALLSGHFPYFREALKRRPYIDFYEHNVWARSMARYVLRKTIEKGALL